MKSLFCLTLILSIFLFTDCNKNKFIPDDEIPQWLKERIAEEEAIIDSSEHSESFISVWIRYEFRDQYYFEYDNPLSSVMFEIYNFDGEGFNSSDEEYIKTYHDGKCCKRYVWKSPGYEEFFSK